MELSGEIVIGAPRERVWAGLNDAEILVRCIPGCESLELTSPTERRASVRVKVGPVRARFVGQVRMEQIRVDEGCSLSFEGSGGAAGMAKGVSKIELSDMGGVGDGTRLHYTVQASVGGKLGQVGGRMIDAAAKQMADQFFAAFSEQLAPAVEAAAPDAIVEPAADTGEPAAPESPLTATAPSPPVVVRAPPPTATPPRLGEGVRVLWFVLGALSTGFGVWIASLIRPL